MRTASAPVVGWFAGVGGPYNSPMITPAIRTESLGRTYAKSKKKRGTPVDPGESPKFVALDGVTLEVKPGEIRSDAAPPPHLPRYRRPESAPPWRACNS